MLWLVSWMSGAFSLGGLYISGGVGSYIWSALVLSFVQTVLGWFFNRDDRIAAQQRQRQQVPPGVTTVGR